LWIDVRPPFEAVGSGVVSAATNDWVLNDRVSAIVARVHITP